MMPYINPNYFSQPIYQPMYQQQTYATPQTTATSTTPMNTLGKVVDSLDVVKATEIPMDGQTYYFPKADGSVVYSKKWLSNGTIQLGSYSPNKALENEKVDNSSSEEEKRVLDTLAQAIEGIGVKVDTLIENTRPNSRTKKVVNNESSTDNKSDIE